MNDCGIGVYNEILYEDFYVAGMLHELCSYLDDLPIEHVGNRATARRRKICMVNLEVLRVEVEKTLVPKIWLSETKYAF